MGETKELMKKRKRKLSQFHLEIHGFFEEDISITVFVAIWRGGTQTSEHSFRDFGISIPRLGLDRALNNTEYVTKSLNKSIDVQGPMTIKMFSCVGYSGNLMVGKVRRNPLKKQGN